MKLADVHVPAVKIQTHLLGQDLLVPVVFGAPPVKEQRWRICQLKTLSSREYQDAEMLPTYVKKWEIRRSKKRSQLLSACPKKI